MKKLLAILMVLIMALSAVPALAAEGDVTVELDGVPVDCKNANGVEVPPILIDGTTYLPVRAIANALNLTVSWDDATKTVFINGVSVLAKKSDVINIFINGAKFTATDVNGNIVNPILKDGTTYLPVRAIGEAFDKEVEWIGETKTVKLTSKVEEKVEIVATVLSKDKTYAIVNKETGKALTATDYYAIEPKDFDKSTQQAFRFIPTTDVDGFYFIQSVLTGQCFDVSGHSTAPGGEIITWEQTGADNQKFTIKDVEGGTLIYSYSSGLPVEQASSNTIQNSMTNKPIQLWSIVEVTVDAPVIQTTGAYRTFNIAGNYLTDNWNLVIEAGNNGNSQKWKLTEVSDGEYTITSLNTNNCLDVSGMSMNAGDPIITWEFNEGINQRWTLEKNSDGTYLIKSVYSGLYLTINDDYTLIQAYQNPSLKQRWTMEYAN